MKTGRFHAKCIKHIGCYQEGEAYDLFLNGLFSTRPYTPEERDSYKKAFNKELPDTSMKFIEGNRVCLYKFFTPAQGDSGYTVFEDIECLSDYFDLIPK